jgi:hypothetical protein
MLQMLILYVVDVGCGHVMLGVCREKRGGLLMLDVAHNTGRNTSCLSIVPGRREEDTTLDVARNMLATWLKTSPVNIFLCYKNLFCVAKLMLRTYF